MLRPEQSSYPTPENKFNESKLVLEKGVADGKFTFPSNVIAKSPKLDEWLLTFGWKLVYVEGDYREHDPAYYKLEPANV